MVEIPDTLVERLKARQAVLVTGMGCSELAGAPGWKAFAESLAARLVFSDAQATATRLIGAGRLGDALAVIRDLLPPPALEEAIRQSYPGEAPVPEGLKVAGQFPWRAIVTTAYDDLWERALDSGDRPEPLRIMVGTEATAAARFGGTGAPLLHLFGRVASPKSLCLGPADARTRLVPSAGLGWLDHLRRRRTLVFVGFRPGDPDLEWLTSWLAARPAEGGPHFLFLDMSAEAEPDVEELVWTLRTGLEILPCLEGTAEALARLAKIAASIAAQLPPSDAEIDLDQWLDRWARDPADPQPRQVLARAEAALRDEERWDRLVELLLKRLDLQDDRHQQVAALGEVAKIFRERLGAPERALTAGVVMLRLLPTDDDLWEKLRGDARNAGAWKQLCAEATGVAREAGTSPGAARIWREIARIEQDELQHPEDALASYQRALAADPGHRETRDAQAELLRQLGRWPELVAVLRAAAAESDDPVRAVGPLLEAAEVMEASLGNVAGAIAAYEGALVIAPESQSTALALERLYEGERRWADLATLIDRRADRAPSEEARGLRRRRAEILADHLDALDLAAEELEELAIEDDQDRATLVALELIYRRAERHDDLLRTLRRQADAAPSLADRLALLRKLAEEGEVRPGGLERAAQALEEILRLAPRDEEAFIAITRIDKTAGRHAALVDTLAKRLEVTETVEARRELLYTLGESYERDLDRPEKALDAYAAAEKAGDRREQIYEALARLSERLERWGAAADALLKWADVATEAELRAGVLLEAYRIFIDRLDDRPSAEAALGRALEIVPEHPRALATLARLRAAAGDHPRAADLYQQAAALESEPLEQARLYTEAATTFADQLGQENRAVELFTRALAAQSDFEPASERLVDIYASRKQWAEAEALLDVQARRADAADADRLAAIETRLGGVNVQLYGDLRFSRGEWKQAAELLGSTLKLHWQVLPAADVLDVTLRLARAHAELGETDDAIKAYRDAKAASSENRPAIEALSKLYADKADWPAWVTEREELAAIADGDERAGLWDEIGDACADRLSDAARAEAAYRKALDSEPGRRGTLDKLLAIYTKSGRAEQAVDILTGIANVETDPAVRAKTLHAAAQLYENELNRPNDAAALLERCLDDAPDMMSAFNDLERLRRDAGDWNGLATSYRAMLERLPASGSPTVRLELWNRLAEVAFTRLRDKKLAMTALEEATAIDPTDAARQEKLAHLYDLAGPEARDRAIASHQRLIARDPHRTDSYLALAKLYGEVGDLDKQWCVAAALWYLKKTNPPLEILFRRYRPPQARPSRQPLGEEMWRRVLHPDEDRMLDELLLLAAPYLAAPAAQDPGVFGLKKKNQVDPATDDSLPTRVLIQLADTLGVVKPEVFRPEGETGQTTLFCMKDRAGPRPAIVLGPPTARRSSFDLVFDLGVVLSFLRPERFLKYALRTPGALQMGVEVVLALAGVTGFRVPSGEGAQLAAYLQRTMPPAAAARLMEAGKKLSERGQVDIARWVAATDLSAARVALAMSGDLGAAFRVISGEPIPTSPVPIHRRMADLVAFSVSEDYFACRRHLGLTVG